MHRLRLFFAALLLIASATVHPTTRADGTSGDLRERLAIARAAQRAVPEGSFLSIEHALDVSERIAGSFGAQAQEWAARAARWLASAERGQDPILSARGEILMRGYRSPISQHLQGYAIYTPKDYDPAKKYPLLVMLHGGSANGNLFLGVVLGNNMNWKEYDKHLWDTYVPRWSPNFIVVAPDGFGHVMWRWMGEQDVLDVIADVQKHYAVDPDRIALGGLSNGGVGAYNIGMRHASRFSIVTPIAGAPSWLQYAGGRVPKEQERAMIAQSGMQLAENAINTDLRYYHGRTDGGPMKPRFVEELTAYIKTLSVPYTEKWFDAGHDLLYLVHRHGKIYGDLLAPARRKQRPSEVRVTTSDYRASRQHWVNVTRIASYPAMARVRAVAQSDRIDVETRNTRAFELDLREAPVTASGALKIAVDGREVCSGPRAQLGDVARLLWDGQNWKPGSPAAGALEKKPKLSGPITDAYFDAVLHVYGTRDAQATEALKRTAERSASGSPLWLWRVKQRVLADTEVTDADLRNHHVVLYATPGSHALLERMQAKLPVKIDAEGVQLGAERFSGRGVGVKLIYPNPLAPERYVIVQAAPTAAGVDGGRNLPDFLPDYVVYDAGTTATRPRLAFGGKQVPRAMGYFDDHWQLTSERAQLPATSEPLIFTNASSVPAPAASAPAPAPAPLPAPPALDARTSSLTPLPTPPAPTVFAAAESTPAGRAARQIAKRVALFPSYRSKIKYAMWSLNPLASWSIRDDSACLQALGALGVQARAYEGPLTTPVATPVEVLAPVAGLSLRMIHARRTLLMSCELATRLPELAAILRPHGVIGIDVMSSYRDHPWASFHTLGLALDISRFTTAEGPLVVRSDFEKTPAIPTCEGDTPARAPAQKLRAIACALAESHRFSSVLTPNYNVGHHDHFHIDVRPDDPRIFVR